MEGFVRNKMPYNRKGKNNANWKGGITHPPCEICKKPITYKAKRCAKHRDKNGSNNPKWRGGRPLTYEGYVQIYSPYHPYRNNYGYVLEHRLVMERHLKRFLTRKEVVHHINGIKDDNRLKNLKLFSGHSEHQKYHAKLNAAKLRDKNKERNKNGITS